jgi:EccD-like transmembrane domain
VMAQRLGRRASGGLIALSSLPLYAAAGAGLAGLADADATAVLAAALGTTGVGAAIAILVAGDAVLAPAVGIVAATLLPALVLGGCALVGAGSVSAAALLCPIAVIGLAQTSRVAVRIAGVNDASAASLSARARKGRQILAALLIGIAIVLIVSSAVLTVSGGWFAWGLVAATAVGLAVKARHFRFGAEVVPLLAAGLAGLLMLEYPLIVAVAVGPRGTGGAAAVLIADALILAVAGGAVRRWDLSPRLRRQLGRVEAIASVATVPLALGALGLYEAVSRLVHGLA